MTDSASPATDSLASSEAALQAARALWKKSHQVLARAGECPSPCVSVCRMSADSGLCLGCWRDLSELRVWGQATEAFKREVWQRIQDRLRSAYPQGLV